MKERRNIPFIADEDHDWGFVTGDYSRFKGVAVERPNWAEDYERLPIEQLRGCELFFRDIIAYYLQRNRKTGRPTIAWDVGAMAATSWVRLGCSFRRQVRSGELAIVASSRTFDPKTSGFRALTSREGTAFLQANNHLVHYLTATPNDFEDLSIALPNGRQVDLAGNVQFVHEADSLSLHSIAPEYEINLLAQMVSEDGIYFSRGGFPYPDHLEESDYRDNGHFQHVLRAHQRLTTSLGFTLTTQVEAGRRKGEDLEYAVFRRPGSPQIALN